MAAKAKTPISYNLSELVDLDNYGIYSIGFTAKKIEVQEHSESHISMDSTILIFA